MTDTPTHWTQFDRLYDLPDPRPYFRGVATGDYRMPGVLAGILERLMPALTARRPAGRDGPLRLIDFACGYGAVGLCLRHGMTMTDLFDFYTAEGRPEDDPDAFAARRRDGLPAHRLDGIDIAGRALDYARSTGALDGGYRANLLEDAPTGALADALARTDLIFESGAIGEHVGAAMDALLAGGAREARAWLILCPRPRVDVRAVESVLEGHGYRLEILLPEVRYRLPFSDGEGDEEREAGRRNGIAPEDCFTDGYFRTDVRIAVPSDDSAAPARTAMQGFTPNAA